MPAARQRWAKRHLSRQVITASALGSQVATPAFSRSRWSRRTATISSATVHTSALASLLKAISHSAGTKPGSLPSGTTPLPCAKRSPTAEGSASAATTLVTGTRARTTATPAGPPPPVTSTVGKSLNAPPTHAADEWWRRAVPRQLAGAQLCSDRPSRYWSPPHSPFLEPLPPGGPAAPDVPTAEGASAAANRPTPIGCAQPPTPAPLVRRAPPRLRSARPAGRRTGAALVRR